MNIIPELSLKTGGTIPQLGFGTYMVGGGMKHDPKNDDAGQIKVIQNAIKAASL